ncbi:MAG: helix-turn-helix transcriptional regulator [Pseudomonadota bacterium]
MTTIERRVAKFAPNSDDHAPHLTVDFAGGRVSEKAPIQRGPYRRSLIRPGIASIREQAGLTQKQLAELAGMSERTIRKHEKTVQGGAKWVTTGKTLRVICVSEIERRTLMDSPDR